MDRFDAFGPPKSKVGIRDIPLPPNLLRVPKEWMLPCPNGMLGLVFPNGNGGIGKHGNIPRVFWPIQITAGVTVMRDGKDHQGRAVRVPDAKFSLHALRHAAAALWIEQGLGAKCIQTLMGHASIQQAFDRYGDLLEATMTPMPFGSTCRWTLPDADPTDALFSPAVHPRASSGRWLGRG